VATRDRGTVGTGPGAPRPALTGGIRHRWAFTAASLTGLSALAAFVAAFQAHRDNLDYDLDERPGDARTWVLLVLGLALLALALAYVGYALHAVGTGGAVAATVLLALLALFFGAGLLFLPYFALIPAGSAIAAGDPLPPPDPGDDRLTRPMPRREDS
jgi:hypothetical protein